MANDTRKRGDQAAQVLRVFEIIRRANGRVYRYARVTIEGGPLSRIGVRPGDTVVVDQTAGGVRIRAAGGCRVRGCRGRHFRRGFCRRHARQRATNAGRGKAGRSRRQSARQPARRS